MTQQRQKTAGRQPEVGEEQPPAGGTAGRARQAAAINDELVDDVERLLLENLGFDPDEPVDEDEVTKRAAKSVACYQQKNGQ